MKVSRSSRRVPLMLELYGFTVQQEFPVISIPLRESDPDVSIELSEVFRKTYRAGPYRKVLRYDFPPEPPLAPAVLDWARNLVESRSKSG